MSVLAIDSFPNLIGIAVVFFLIGRLWERTMGGKKGGST
jgi:hypothetical protein